MDDLVLQKLIALDWCLTKMYWKERLEQAIDQLDNEIAAEHGEPRTCTHVETFIDPTSGYVTCMACGKSLHEAI